jgi:tRNA (adenine57-N1/adenine58-N1)-methyltransferase catalytic subunit
VPEDQWAEGDPATLLRADRPIVVACVTHGAQRVGDAGVIDLSSQVGAQVGGEVRWLGESYRLVRPSLSDLLSTVRRGAQIVGAKDAAQLLHMASVRPGARVGEAGAGSGALTLVLAYTVGPNGQVYSYDRRKEFLDNARANVARAHLDDRVDFRLRDVVAHGFDVTGLESLILDLPEPWSALGWARVALGAGGHVATYTPTYNQLERTVRSLRGEGFAEVRALELIERGLHVGEGGTRPEFEMLGHTGFLAVARKVE